MFRLPTAATSMTLSPSVWRRGLRTLGSVLVWWTASCCCCSVCGQRGSLPGLCRPAGPPGHLICFINAPSRPSAPSRLGPLWFQPVPSEASLTCSCTCSITELQRRQSRWKYSRHGGFKRTIPPRPALPLIISAVTNSTKYIS